MGPDASPSASDSVPLSLELARNEDGSAGLRASPSAWRELGEALRAAALGDEPRRSGRDLLAGGGNQVSQGDPARSELRLQSGGDPVRVRWAADGALEVRGGGGLLHLSAWCDVLASRPGERVRLEWYGSHYYLAESAVPLELCSVAGNESGSG